jgi:uncharacterized membrane protein YdjX (TVP38/TMEM64 family)
LDALAQQSRHRCVEYVAVAGGFSGRRRWSRGSGAAARLVPGSIPTLTAGVLFGPVLGSLYALAGATAGATLAFLVARHLAADWVAEKAGRRLKQLIAGVDAEGWRFVAFVRLVPLFPFNFLNYALGLTRIRLLDYVFASFVCMAPGAIAYTYLGYAGREALAGGEALIQKGLIALGLLALVVLLPRLIRRLRAAPSTTADEAWIEVPELADRLHGAKVPMWSSTSAARTNSPVTSATSPQRSICR